MRVLFLLTQSLTSPSGLGRYGPLARQMVKLGYQVEIAALHPAWSSARPREFVQDGVKVSYVAQMHVRQEGNRRTYFNAPQLLIVTALATAGLARAALSSRANVIHIAKAQPMNGLAGWLSARLRQRRLYLDCDDDESASNRFAAEWQRRIVNWWERRLPHVARGVTVNTSYLRERCARWGISPNRIRLISNGFDPDRFQLPTPPEIESVRARWGLTGRQVVLYLGTLNLANHPILLLLDAFDQVRQRIPLALLLLAGRGADHDRVAEEIRARGLESVIILAGRVDPSAVASIYAASDLTVDPVLDDDTARARSPLKIVESLAMGVPVVTGDVGDRAMMLDGGRAGVLVKPGDADALAEGIVSVLNDRARHAGMAEQARIVSQRYRWDHLAQQFVAIYEI